MDEQRQTITMREDDASVQQSLEQQIEMQQQQLEQLRLESPLQQSSATQQTTEESPESFILDYPEVSRVSMRMPEFPADPELWFGIVNRRFQAAGITVDVTKFGYALTAIGLRCTIEVHDIIMNPPAERAYETLKAELIKCLSLRSAQEHKTRRLLEHEETENRETENRFSFCDIFAVSPETWSATKCYARYLWLNQLPAYIQPHLQLVTRSTYTIDQLADIADAILFAQF